MLSFLLLSLLPAALAVPFPQTSGGNGSSCANPRVRKEWRQLTNDEKSAYLDAVTCLFKSPGKGAQYFPAIQTRHDDFAAQHINMTTGPDNLGANSTNRGLLGPGIHFNGVFLPWHRYATWTYENALIDECGYNGTQPYWAWSMDTPEANSSFEKSPIFDATYGFGGNGINGSSTPLPGIGISGSCINNGPFANISNPVGPGFNLTAPQPHCIKRNIQTDSANQALRWNADVMPLLKMTNYVNFTLSFDKDAGGQGGGTGIHGGGHSGVNGEMSNVWSSINDPLFYMHHANLDRIWWLWQTLSDANLNAVGGPMYPNGTGTVDANYPVEMSPFIAPTLPISKVLDPLNRDGQGILCYTYSDNGEALPSKS